MPLIHHLLGGVRSSTIFLLVLTLCLGLASNADAGLLQGAFEGNYYAFVEVSDPYSGSNNSWWTAEDAAEASVYNGVHGHLATITSQQENEFLFSLVQDEFPVLPISNYFLGAWLGGKQPEGWLVGPEAGDSFTYTNWRGGEPNNLGYAYFSLVTDSHAGKWLDDSAANNGLQGYPDPTYDPVIGYFVEYEGAAIPEPATLLVWIGLSGFALGATRWRTARTA